MCGGQTDPDLPDQPQCGGGQALNWTDHLGRRRQLPTRLGRVPTSCPILLTLPEELWQAGSVTSVFLATVCGWEDTCTSCCLGYLFLSLGVTEGRLPDHYHSFPVIVPGYHY